MPPPTPTPAPTHSHHITTLLIVLITLFLFPGLPQYLVRLPLLPFIPANPPRLAHTFADTSPAYTSPITKGTMSTGWLQKPFSLPRSPRGSHLITRHVTSSLPEIQSYKAGLLHLFIQHTSAALSLNENTDPDVRSDMSDALDRIVPEDREQKGLYRHADEGWDDMPAHVKNALIGSSVSIPITDGKLALGTWQGIWLLEFRQGQHVRRVVATVQGERM